MIKMKDSGIPWIGQIPEDWEVCKVKNFFIYKKRIVGDDAENWQRLALTLNGVIKRSKDDSEGLQPEKFEGYQILMQNELVFKLIDLNNIQTSRVGLSNYDGIVSPAYIILSPQNISVLFSYYYFISLYYRNIFNTLGDDGVRSSLNSLDLLNLKIVVPPQEIQQKIVEILDKKCGQIDELVRIEENEIEKLKEYKTSLITKVVTKGLDPNAKMKDSGIPWIGQIPYDWEVKRLKYIADIFLKGNGITKDDVVGEGNTPCVRYGDIYTTYEFKFNECKTRTNKEKFSNLQYFTHGDILFTTTGELVEEIGKSVVYMGNKECLAGGDVVIMKHSQEPVFLGYALESSYVREQKSFGKLKLKVVHISIQDISNLYVALPTKNEQVIIGKYLDEKCEEIDNLIKIKQEKIEKLKEYKKSLIYQYVTGKKEVV